MVRSDQDVSCMNKDLVFRDPDEISVCGEQCPATVPSTARYSWLISFQRALELSPPARWPSPTYQASFFSPRLSVRVSPLVLPV